MFDEVSMKPIGCCLLFLCLCAGISRAAEVNLVTTS